MHFRAIIFTNLLLAYAAKAPQYYGIVSRVGQSNGLTRVALNQSGASSDYWQFEVPSVIQGGYGSAVRTFVVSEADQILYYMTSSQYWNAIINRVSLKGNSLPPVTASIASVAHDVAPTVPMHMILINRTTLLALLAPDKGNANPWLLLSIDLSQPSRPAAKLIWTDFHMSSQDLQVSYTNASGKFIIAQSFDPTISFFTIDAATGKSTSLASMDCAGGALTMTYTGDKLVGLSSHYIRTNVNQMYGFQVDLKQFKCLTQKIPLPLDFFPWSYVFPSTSQVWFIPADRVSLHMWDFDKAALNSSIIPTEKQWDAFVESY